MLVTGAAAARPLLSAAVSSSLVFISGASSGIGQALAQSVPWAEARVLNISRRRAKGCENFPADLADPASWPQVAAFMQGEIAGFRGPRIVFVHSAGSLEPIGFAGEVEADSYARQVLLNAAAPQVLGDAFLRASRGHPAERTLLMIGSGAAQSSYEGWSAYCGGKAAVDHWVRTTALEQTRRGGCRILCIAPGIIATAMQEQIRDTPVGDFPEVERFRGLHEEGALREPLEVARELWAAVDGDLPGGSVIDLRND